MTLPVGFVVQLNRRTTVVDGGRALLGGSPTRLLRLKPRARPLLVDGRVVVGDDPASAVLADLLLDCGMADPVLDATPLPDGTAVTYVIPVLDRPLELDRLLAGIVGQVIVVDDGSRDGSAIAEVAHRHGARLIRSDVNRGPAAARNAGLECVNTSFVVFADSDIVIESDTVTRLLRHFADPRVGMAVPQIEGFDSAGSEPGWISLYESARSSLDLGDEPAAVVPGTHVSWASSACIVARTAALGSGFDATMRVGEDVDLTWRLVETGWRVRYEPAVRVRHENRATLRTWAARKFFYGTGAAGLARRHPDYIAPAILSPLSATFVLTLAAQRWWSAPVAAVVAIVVLLRIRRHLAGIDGAWRLAAQLAGGGLLSSLSQGMALVLRHWWPLAALGCLLSRRVRRLVLLAAVADAVIEWRRTDTTLDPVRFGVARRLDDLAYGAGVWSSALRTRAWRAFLPAIRHRAPKVRWSAPRPM